MRRLTSLLSIFAIVVLVVMLFWRVHLHHQTFAGAELDDRPSKHVRITMSRP